MTAAPVPPGGDLPGIQLKVHVDLSLQGERFAADYMSSSGLEKWLADAVEGEPSHGAEMRWRPAPGSSAVELVEVVEWRPPELFALRLRQEAPGWDAWTPVTIECGERPGGCRVSVSQWGFERLAISSGLTFWEAYRRRWREALVRLQTLSGA